MPRATVYFSFEKQEKFCNGCKTNVSLSKFRVGSDLMVGPEMSSHYRYICRDCENSRAKVRQKKTYVVQGRYWKHNLRKENGRSKIERESQGQISKS